MKLKKLTAVGAGIALAIGSVFGVSLAASAIEVPVNEIGVEGASYPANQWFLGKVTTPDAGPAPTQDASGLTITGKNQLLYGKSMPGLDGTAFTNFVASASFAGSGQMAFQIPVFFSTGSDRQFTTLRPDSFGVPAASGTWISSQAVAGLPAGAPVPFADIVAAFDSAAGQAEVLAFGVFVNPGATAVLESVTAGGETWTFNTPVPAGPTDNVDTPDNPAVAPTPIKKSATFTG